jgi:hypothetical protein
MFDWLDGGRVQRKKKMVINLICWILIRALSLCVRTIDATVIERVLLAKYIIE